MTTPTTTSAPRVRRTTEQVAGEKWVGRTREYDLVKEFVVALVGVALLTAALAGLFSSPDEKQLTLADWSAGAPNDFVATAAAELAGTSGSATYGAPYTRTPQAAQKIGPVSLQHLAGVTHPVDTAGDLVLRPLAELAGPDTAVARSLQTYRTAGADRQQQWASAYDSALQAAPDTDPAQVASGEYGPVPVMLAGLLSSARSGGLDGALVAQGGFFQTDYTKALLFLGDGTFLEDWANGQHLAGDQWGMMNETGNYPGQAWLWLYTFWYQIKPFSTSGNADALVWGIMAVLSVGLVLVPFLPGVRSIPGWVPVHRLVWRDYYRRSVMAPNPPRA